MHVFRWFALCAVVMGVCVGVSAQDKEAAPAKAGEKIDLKINFTPGTYVVTKEVTMHVDTAGERPTASQIHTVMVMDMEVGKPDAQGNRDLAVTYRQIKFDQKQGEQAMKYDSSAGTPAEQLPPMGKMFEGMLGKTVTVTLDGHGKVSQIKGVDEMIASMLHAGMDEQAAEALKKQFGDRIAEETFGQLLIMPGKPVAKGDTWEVDKPLELPVIGSVQYTQICTLKDVSDGVATVGVKGTLRSVGGKAPTTQPGAPTMMIHEMTVEGTTLMEIATGMAKRSDVTQKGTLTVTAGEGAEKRETKITLNGTAKTTIEKK